MGWAFIGKDFWQLSMSDYKTILKREVFEKYVDYLMPFTIKILFTSTAIFYIISIEQMFDNWGDIMLSACGILCDECEFLGKNCQGCSEVQGKPFWVEEMKVANCALYDCCVNQRSFKHCGHCESLPCKIFFEYKDPSMSDEEHAQGVKMRVDRLKSN